MKTKSKSSHHYNWWKIATLSMVVLASVYFIWQFVFVKNTTGSKASTGAGQICHWSSSCPTNYKCVKRDGSTWGTCESKNWFQGEGGNVNLKCNCTTQFGSCGDKWGYTNIKSRQCAISVFSGTETCNFTVGGKLYQWASCD